MRVPSAEEDFLFDLRGYLTLKNALEPELVDELNAEFDKFPRDLPMGEWYKGAQRRDYQRETGMELHHCLEIGGPFDKLIDHPSWLQYVLRYCGDYDSYVEGLFIDECLTSTRVSGGYHHLHSGGHHGALRGRYEYINGLFRCGQVNILMALTDIGEGDGATMVVPGSHKSNFPIPQMHTKNPEYAVEARLKKGDALLFCDGIAHGGSERFNEGERRVIIFRYGPAWGATRFGYVYSQELLDRLNPRRRAILEPVPKCYPGSNTIPVESALVSARVNLRGTEAE